MQTRKLVRAATKNTAKYEEQSRRIRDAQARAANKTLPLKAARGWQIKSRRLVYYTGSSICFSSIGCIHTSANGINCKFSLMSAGSSRSRPLCRSATNIIVPWERFAPSQSVRAFCLTCFARQVMKIHLLRISRHFVVGSY